MSSKCSTSSYKYVYLHGFASSPKSGKGQLLKDFFASHKTKIKLDLPDLNIPSFEELSVTSIVQKLKTEIVNSKQQYRLIGSSLGGLIAAKLAFELKQSSQIQSLLLLCPALDAAERWKATMTHSELQRWKTEGIKRFYNYNTKSDQPLHYAFYEDLLQQPPYPLIDLPITIVHGLNDGIVPISVSRNYIEFLCKSGINNAELIEVNDDHALMAALSIKAIKCVIKRKWLNEEADYKR